MAQQHFYSRVPARVSMYNKYDGFDTFDFDYISNVSLPHKHNLMRQPKTKISFSVSVAAVAALFGGGGHAMASGIRMAGELEDCRERVLNAIRKELNHD